MTFFLSLNLTLLLDIYLIGLPLEESGSLAVIDLMTLQQVDNNPLTTGTIDPITLPTGAKPRAIVNSLEDRYVYVADYRNGNIYVVDIDSRFDTYHQVIQIIDLGTGVSNGIKGLAVSSDGKRLFATAPGTNSESEGEVYVINIDSDDKPEDPDSNPNNWHEVIGTILTEPGVQGITTTPDPSIMLFANRREEFQGIGRIKIDNNDPNDFSASVSYTALGLGGTQDYFDVNEAFDITLTSDGEYAFVAGRNARLLGSGIPSIDSQKAGSNVGIIADPLTENARLIAATRPIPNAFTTDVSITSDDKYLFAAYPGVGGVYAWDFEEMLKTIDNPADYTIDHLGRGIDSPIFRSSTARSATDADLERVPIDNINPDIKIASDLQLTKERYFFNGFDNDVEIEYGVPDDSDRAPLTVGFNPWSITNVGYNDWLELEEEQWTEIQIIREINDEDDDEDDNITIKSTLTGDTLIEIPLPNGDETSLDYEALFKAPWWHTIVKNLPGIPPQVGLIADTLLKIDFALGGKLTDAINGAVLVGGVLITLPILVWKIIDTYDVVEAELFISTHPEGEGLFDEENDFVEDNPDIDDSLLKTTTNGVDDYNPNRVYTIRWEDAGFDDGRGRWELDGITFEDLLPPNVFPYVERLNLTAGQKYYWGVRVRSENKGWERERGGEFVLPLAQPLKEQVDGDENVLLSDTDNSYSSVTFITPEASAFDDRGLSTARAVANSIVDDINGDNDGGISVDGAVLQYSPETGDWVTIPGSEEPELGRPLVLIADWLEDSQSSNYNSGFAEGAADSFFASLVDLNSDQTTANALFNSPFHFMGMGRGAVVNSEIIQRLGTYFPKDREEYKKMFPDLQMTTIDPNDFNQTNRATGLLFSNYLDPEVHIWDNVTFADNYYQTATKISPQGRHIRNDIPAKLLPPNSPTINEPDLSVHLGGYLYDDDDNEIGLFDESRVGFTEESLVLGRNPHTRTTAWYGGTTNLGWYRNRQGEDNHDFGTAIHRRKGDFSFSELNPDPDNLLPWYTPNHTFQDLGEENAQWEGVGTGWYYSVQGGGYYKRDLLRFDFESPLPGLPPVPVIKDPQRTPVEYDNTYIDEAFQGRLRGDFAVPTLFNGNFDATAVRFFSQPIPGWSLHNSEGEITQQSSLAEWSAIPSLADHRSKVGYDPLQRNYALKLNSGDSITHNRFVVPDWGVLRFDLHVPNAASNPRTPTSSVRVFIKEANTTGTGQSLQPVFTYSAINPSANTRPNAVGYYDYINGTYVDPYTYQIGYGVDGFETFHLDIPEELRGKAVELEFRLLGGSSVYIDDVFFKSKHILLGNPSDARYNDDSSPRAYPTNNRLN